MNLRYRVKDGTIIRVFHSNIGYDEEAGFYGAVSIDKNINGNYRKAKRIVKDDEGNLYFNYENQKILFNDFICYTPEEFVEEINKSKSNICDDDLCATLLKYGIDSLHLILRQKPLDFIYLGDIKVGFKVSSSLDKKEEYPLVEYKFVPEYLRMPIDNYKLKCEAADGKLKDIFPKEDYYVCDLVSLLTRCKDDFKIIVNTNKKEAYASFFNYTVIACPIKSSEILELFCKS